MTFGQMNVELLEQKSRQDKWDRRYLELAKLVSTWSKDPSTQVGAVIVNFDLQREFVGYNGFPRGVNDSPERYADRELKYKLVVHAESNAIRKAGDYARGSTLYVYPSFSMPPICNECAKDAIQAGIKDIVGFAPDMNDPRVQRWLEAIKISQMMFQEAGIPWRTIQP
jgi:dCMP deaminase